MIAGVYDRFYLETYVFNAKLLAIFRISLVIHILDTLQLEIVPIIAGVDIETVCEMHCKFIIEIVPSSR